MLVSLLYVVPICFPQESLKALHIRVIRKVTLSLDLVSPPYPLFQWSPQSKEFLLDLSMKC
jgi:hypothetical protein